MLHAPKKIYVTGNNSNRSRVSCVQYAVPVYRLITNERENLFEIGSAVLIPD